MTIPNFSQRVLIGGVETTVFSMSARFGKDQPVGTCTLILPNPPPVNVVLGANVVVDWAVDGVYWDEHIFVGKLPAPEKSLTADDSRATYVCSDRAGNLLSMLLERDKAFTGGNKAAPVTLISSPLHLGDETISWYADTTPVGIQHDETFTPVGNSTFVWVAYDVHGSNSYDTSVGDKKIKTWSRIEVRQDGELLGYANLPESSEQWDDELDYTDKDNWDNDQEAFIAATIVAADGDVTIRLKSGYKPGTTDRDEYEVDDLTYQTAGQNTLREIVRGICKLCGLVTSQYDVPEIKSYAGNTIRLGGNGLVEAGQIVVPGTESPLAWINRVLGLFGWAFFSCPDGVMRARRLYGQPSSTPFTTFTEGVDVFSFSPLSSNPKPYNAVEVAGASGNDQNGKRFEYLYQTADVDIAPHPLINNPSGIAKYRAPGGNELTNNTLCEYVGKVAELEGDWTTITMEVVPRWMRPGNVFAVDSPTIVEADFWTTGVTFEATEDGDFRQTVSGRVGAAEPFDEEADDAPEEDPSEPGNKRRALEWLPFAASAAVA